jgi:hypothetical protein
MLLLRAARQVAAVIERKNANVTFHVDVADGGRFFLYFANCEAATPVSFAVRRLCVHARLCALVCVCVCCRNAARARAACPLLGA